MKKFFAYVGGYFGLAIILLVSGFICLGIANWVEWFKWPAFVLLGLLTILVVCGIVYVWLIRPIVNYFRNK